MEPPLSRQPACGQCGHEEHIFFACEDCLCGAHDPTGVYPEEA
jgi:primosomal protein N'